MRKSIYILPVIIGSFLLCSSETVSRYLAGGSVFVIYDAGEGRFDDGENMIGCRVRLGATWGKLYPSEKPSNNPKPEDYPQTEFDGWYLNGEPLDPEKRISADCVVTASYVARLSPHGDFENDAWSVLAREAALGLTSMKEKYKEYLSEHNNTFVGCTKSITFNGQKYTARVIGEEDDIDEEGNPVALTFELTNVITDIPYSMIESNRYSESLLREQLNGEIYQLFEKGARENFKTVVKKNNMGNGTSSKPSTGKIEETHEKIFPLSLSEMDGEKYIEKFTMDHAETDPKYVFHNHRYEGGEWVGNIEDEGSAYDYYKVDPTAPIYRDLSRTALNASTKLTYWVRSPDVEASVWTWVIDNQGLIGEYDGFMLEQAGRVINDTSVAVAPCFAI